MAKFDVPEIKYDKPPTYDEMVAKVADMSYQSPVEIICGNMKTKFEGDVIEVIRSYDIKVDKDELIKALQYDRHQYEKGFADACKLNTKGEWISNRQTDELICSLCGAIAPVDCEKERFYRSNYCPNCGAKMKEGTTQKYFSPEEVRKMTPKEVRENYDLVIQSMRRW